MKNFRLDMVLEQKSFLLHSETMERFQQFLKDFLPNWSSKLHDALASRNKTPHISLDKPGSLRDALMALVNDRGELYERLSRYSPPSNFIFGNVELLGKDDALSLILRVDQREVRRRGMTWAFGNEIAFQVCSDSIEKTPSPTWALRIFPRLMEIFNPQYGYACMQGEYESKNISREGGGMMAIGRDISKYLPGIYWLNFFGPEYSRLIGKSTLLNAPAPVCQEIADGVLLCLDHDPESWATEAYRARETAVLEHIGPQYFFLRDAPNRETQAPDFPSMARWEGTGKKWAQENEETA